MKLQRNILKYITITVREKKIRMHLEQKDEGLFLQMLPHFTDSEVCQDD